MVKRDIAKYLLGMLNRKTPELLILVVTFLKKLSIFKENRDEILKNPEEFLEKICKILDTTSHKGLHSLVLRLVLNLSHDSGFRAVLLQAGFHDRLVNKLDEQHYILTTLQLLYQLSIEDRNRSYPAFTNCIPDVSLSDFLFRK